MRISLGIIGVVAAFLLVNTVLVSYGLGIQRLAMPFQEETRRLTFEQSQSYQHGTARELDRLCREWSNEEDATAKAAIANSISHRMAAYNGDVPDYLSECLEETTQ